MEAGAKDFSYHAADNAHAYIRALPHEGPTDMPNCGLSMCPYVIWVNEEAERFVREDCALVNFCQQNPPRWNQKDKASKAAGIRASIHTTPLASQENRGKTLLGQ